MVKYPSTRRILSGFGFGCEMGTKLWCRAPSNTSSRTCVANYGTYLRLPTYVVRKLAILVRELKRIRELSHSVRELTSTIQYEFNNWPPRDRELDDPSLKTILVMKSDSSAPNQGPPTIRSITNDPITVRHASSIDDDDSDKEIGHLIYQSFHTARARSRHAEIQGVAVLTATHERLPDQNQSSNSLGHMSTNDITLRGAN